MTDPRDIGTRVNDVMAAICAEIPERLGIDKIMRDAYRRLQEACPGHREHVVQKLAEVLREIATHAVSVFTQRTGEPFLWQDEPPFEEMSAADVTMSFTLDPRGNVIFADQAPAEGEGTAPSAAPQAPDSASDGTTT